MGRVSRPPTEPIPGPIEGTQGLPGGAASRQAEGPGGWRLPSTGPGLSLQLPLEGIPGKCPERQGPTLQARPSHLPSGSPSSARDGPQCPLPVLSQILLPCRGGLLCGAAFHQPR